MHPFLIDFGRVDLPLLGEVHLALPTYGPLVALAIAVAWLWFFRLARADGIPGEPAARVVFWTIVGGIVGGKLGLVLVDLDLYLARPERLFSLDLLTAAGVVWAAILGGLCGLVLAARKNGLPTAPLLDVAAVTMPVAQAIGRVGCLLAGCCYGGACSMPWAISYHSHEAYLRTGVPLGVPLHPTPLYEVAWSLAVVLPAVLLARRLRRSAGEVVLAYLVAYGVGRFFIEFFRADTARGLWLGETLSTSQLVSLAVVPVAAYLWLSLRRSAGQAGSAATRP